MKILRSLFLQKFNSLSLPCTLANKENSSKGLNKTPLPSLGLSVIKKKIKDARQIILNCNAASISIVIIHREGYGEHCCPRVYSLKKSPCPSAGMFVKVRIICNCFQLQLNWWEKSETSVLRAAGEHVNSALPFNTLSFHYRY